MDKQLPVLQEPEVKKKINKKLLFILILLFLVLLAVLFFNSSLGKISDIRISGTALTKHTEIVQVSGLAKGDAFFQTSSSKIKKRLLTLPEVQSAEVSKKFPGVIQIKIIEQPTVAFDIAEDGTLYAILASGTSVPIDHTKDIVMDKPVLTGWLADDPIKQQLAEQLALIPAKQLSDLSEIIPVPSNAYPDRIRMYTRTQFEVITAVSVLPDKIDALNAVIEQQEPGKITMLLADTYVPFDYDEDTSVQSE
ncbi:cell division protein FtsQ/DivIB [Paenibacillus yanchengensis]|uniref:Cell division protein DivIB n=1 Tax=Paenibacillus yanchengensis TaxID=2035833 RepID=A0ABW4YL11_9BACL